MDEDKMNCEYCQEAFLRFASDSERQRKGVEKTLEIWIY